MRKCFHCGSDDCTEWMLEFNTIESGGRSMYSRMCNECHQIMYMPGLFHTPNQNGVITEEDQLPDSHAPKRNYYRDRDKMNEEDRAFCKTLGIKL
jgi:hypothetical protein